MRVVCSALWAYILEIVYCHLHGTFNYIKLWMFSVIHQCLLYPDRQVAFSWKLYVC